MAQLASGAHSPSSAEAERSILLVAAIANEGACSASEVISRALSAWVAVDEAELPAWIALRRSTGSSTSVFSPTRTHDNCGD